MFVSLGFDSNKASLWARRQCWSSRASRTSRRTIKESKLVASTRQDCGIAQRTFPAARPGVGLQSQAHRHAYSIETHCGIFESHIWSIGEIATLLGKQSTVESYVWSSIHAFTVSVTVSCSTFKLREAIWLNKNQNSLRCENRFTLLLKHCNCYEIFSRLREPRLTAALTFGSSKRS